MGMSYRTHLGPFVVAKTWLVDRQADKQGCPKCNKVVYGSQRYCEVCGTAIGTIKGIEKAAAVDYWALADRIKEVLICANSGMTDSDSIEKGTVHFWVPNVAAAGYVAFETTSCENGVEDLTNMDVARELQSFRNQHRSQLGTLAEVYGEKNVEVRWGLVSTAS